MEIKKMESDEEIRGKAYVHWRCWHEVYAGLVYPEYLEQKTLDSFEENAFCSSENVFVAKEKDRVIGFVGYGAHGQEDLSAGEIFTLYVLPECFGTGVGRGLMEAALAELREYPKIFLWVFKENARAIRFYQKCGFRADGTEKTESRTGAAGIRLVLER